MRNQLVPVRITPTKLPIAVLDKGQLKQWRPGVTTLGDALDYGFGIWARCSCSRRVVLKWPQEFQKLKQAIPESTEIIALNRYLVCSKCGSKDDIQTLPADKPTPGLTPRVDDSLWRGVW